MRLEIGDGLKRGIRHFIFQHFHAFTQVVATPNRKNRDGNSRGGVTSASARLIATLARADDFDPEPPTKVPKMPKTVPRRPMKGAEDAMVERVPIPSFKLAEKILRLRRKARSAASMASVSVNCGGAEEKAIRPAATTVATWLQRLRAAMEIT